MGRRRIGAICSRHLFGLVLAIAAGVPAMAQQSYPTPEAAAEALGDAVARDDHEALTKVLGSQYRSLLPEGGVHREDIDAFVTAWGKQHRVVPEGTKRAILSVGDTGWTLPIPIVKAGDGWKYDLVAGRQEILRRRLGRNELAAMDTLRHLAYAQERYADRVGNGSYATQLVSTPGKTDGLYWPAVVSSDSSPLGPDALAMSADTPPEEAFYGYHYRVLSPGDGKAKYAFVAWPAAYGSSGVHTFLISNDRMIYERDLGSATASNAKHIGTYAPDASWTPVEPP